VVRVEEWRGAHRNLVGKPEGKSPLERRRRRWVNNFTKKFQELRWGHDLSYLVQEKGQVSGCCEHGNER
jgi:hypothetical protein